MYLNEEEKGILLRLARKALETYVRRQEEIDPSLAGFRLSERLREPAGVFVTLEKEGRLRGCIGYPEPVHPLYQAVMENVVSSAARDYRFKPVQAEELGEITIEISVLTPKQRIREPSEFVPGEHGILMEKGGRRAVFLPQVATQEGWDREETLFHLCLKAGLPPDAWKEGGRFWIFRAEIFGERKDR